MFGLSFGELAVIVLVGLLVLGPEELPKVIRTASKAWRSIQLAMGDVRRQFDEAVGQEELAELRALRESLKSKKHFILDEDGRYRETYDVSDLTEMRAKPPVAAAPPVAAPANPPDAPSE